MSHIVCSHGFHGRTAAIEGHDPTHPQGENETVEKLEVVVVIVHHANRGCGHRCGRG